MVWSYFLAHSLFTRLPAASGPPNPAPKTLCSSPAKEAKERASLSFPFECVWMKPKQQGPTSSWVTSMLPACRGSIPTTGSSTQVDVGWLDWWVGFGSHRLRRRRRHPHYFCCNLLWVGSQLLNGENLGGDGMLSCQGDHSSPCLVLRQ